MNSYEMKLHGQYLEPEDSKSYGTDWNGVKEEMREYI